MDKLAIFGVPRSGTSWLSQIFNSHPNVACRYQPLFSYSHKGALSETSTANDIGNFYYDILKTRDDFVLMKSSFHENYPEFNKSEIISHILFKETRYLNIIENMLRQCDEIKIFGIIRNPLSVLASWVRAPKEFEQHWDIEKEWLNATKKNNNQQEEFYGYEKWKFSSMKFIEFKIKYPEQIYLINYEELRRNTLENTEKMFTFCALNMQEQVVQYINDCSSTHNEDPYSVYRSKSNENDWETVLSDEIIKKITNDLHDSPLAEYLD